MNTFLLAISSPEGDIFRDNVRMISLRGAEGDLAVMAGHIPFVTTVKPCNVKITLDDGTSYRCGVNHIHNVSYRKDKNSEPIWENVDTKFILNHPDYNFQFRVAD